jgi:hypothetical protein
MSGVKTFLVCLCSYIVASIVASVSAFLPWLPGLSGAMGCFVYFPGFLVWFLPIGICNQISPVVAVAAGYVIYLGLAAWATSARGRGRTAALAIFIALLVLNVCAVWLFLWELRDWPVPAG